MTSPATDRRPDAGQSRSRMYSALLDYLVELYMAVAPQNPGSMWLKRILLHWRGARLGRRVKIWRDVWIDDYRGLSMGDEVTIGKSAMLLCGGGVRIGDRAMVGHGAKIVSAGHRIPESRETSMRWSGPEHAPINIGPDSWIGAGAIILPGANIGKGAVIAAGAVVSRPVPDYAVAAGVPASVIHNRP